MFSVKYSAENSVFREVCQLFTYLISISILLSLKSISEFSGAASSMSDIVTSANGLVAREADTTYLSLSGRGLGVWWALINWWIRYLICIGFLHVLNWSFPKTYWSDRLSWGNHALVVSKVFDTDTYILIGRVSTFLWEDSRGKFCLNPTFSGDVLY